MATGSDTDDTSNASIFSQATVPTEYTMDTMDPQPGDDWGEDDDDAFSIASLWAKPTISTLITIDNDLLQEGKNTKWMISARGTLLANFGDSGLVWCRDESTYSLSSSVMNYHFEVRCVCDLFGLERTWRDYMTMS